MRSTCPTFGAVALLSSFANSANDTPARRDRYNAATATELVMLEKEGCTWREKWNGEVGVIDNKTRHLKADALHCDGWTFTKLCRLIFPAEGGYTPTIIDIDKGREIGRIRGYPGEDFFWGPLGKMLERLPITPTSSDRINLSRQPSCHCQAPPYLQTTIISTRWLRTPKPRLQCSRLSDTKAD